MRKKRQHHANTFKHLHQEIASLPNVYRQAICHECGWSTPTYYRKLRETGTPELTNEEIKSALNMALSITQAFEIKLKVMVKVYNRPDH